MRFRILFAFLFIVPITTNQVFPQQHQIYKKFDNSSHYYDNNQQNQSYELLKKSQKLFLKINKTLLNTSILEMFVNANTSVSIYKQIIYFTEENKLVSYSLDSMLEHSNEDEEFKKNIIEPINRSNKEYENVLLILVLITLIVFAYIKKSHEDIWKIYMKWSTIMSIKSQSDTVYKLRPFQKGTLMIILGYTVTSATAILGFFYLSKFSLPISGYFQSSHWLLTILKWLALVSILYILAFSKYLLIKIFTSLYNFKGASRIHFYNHIRMYMVILISLLSIELIVIFGFHNIILFNWINQLMIILFVIKSLLISLKLIKFTTYRMFHLFSYLCATEIIPAIILIKIAFLT